MLAPPGTRRIYSNRGFELAADHVAAGAGMPFEHYLVGAVIEPLGLTGTRLSGSPAFGAEGPLTDLMALGQELLSPTLVSPATVAHATAVAFPGPGRRPTRLRSPGPQRLGSRRRGPRPQAAPLDREPQLAGDVRALRPVRLVSLGRSRARAGGCLAGRPPFGPWAMTAWPALSDAVIDRYGGP